MLIDENTKILYKEREITIDDTVKNKEKWAARHKVSVEALFSELPVEDLVLRYI